MLELSSLRWLLTPACWFLIAQLVAVWCLWTNRWKLARWIITLSAIAFIAVFYTPFGGVLIRPLEQAYLEPVLPGRIDGIVMLGGSEDDDLTKAYGRATFGDDSERETELLALARRYPEARLVFTGTSSEADVFKVFLASQGHALDRVTLETDSANTYDSAFHTYRLLRPAPEQVWVLVTSAYHMPRAWGAFRKAGWDIVPYPVAYRALPQFGSGDANPVTFSTAVREWLGIAAYKLGGRM
jgi:uncharacterized SAM-binding protein YcdF (DUF218 family)